MTITEDAVTGWATSDGDPRWRSTMVAFRRLTGAQVKWLTARGRRQVHVLHLQDGRPVCVLRRYAASRRWSVNVEGFEFWQHLRIMGREMWAGPVGFDRVADARRFVADVMTQVGATMVRDFSTNGEVGTRLVSDAMHRCDQASGSDRPEAQTRTEGNGE